MGKIKSCSECRRLKLKCIRDGDSWPCVPCRRRRCNELCPDGIANTTEKASSERLLRHYRSRIATLEVELEEQKELNRHVLNETQSYNNQLHLADNAASNAQRDRPEDGGQSSSHVSYSYTGLVTNHRHFHGRSTGALYAHPEDHLERRTSSSSSASASIQRAKAILNQFPFEDAMNLLTLYSESVTWMYSPISCTDIHRFTRRAYDASCTSGEMSVVCLALALGNHFQRTTDSGAQEIHPRLYRAGLECILGFETFEKPSLEAAAACHLCCSYLLSQGESGKSQAAWQMLGIGIRLAVSMGLHCEQKQWGASHEREQACSWAFWELFGG